MASRHDPIARPNDRTIMHYDRDVDGSILTRIIRGGPVTVEPPGITHAIQFRSGPDRGGGKGRHVLAPIQPFREQQQ